MTDKGKETEVSEAGRRSTAETIVPWHNFVVVLPLAPEQVSDGGIIMPTLEQQQPALAEVIVCGPECKFAVPGMIVLMQKYQGILYEFERQEVMLIREDALVGCRQ